MVRDMLPIPPDKKVYASLLINEIRKLDLRSRIENVP